MSQPVNQNIFLDLLDWSMFRGGVIIMRTNFKRPIEIWIASLHSVHQVWGAVDFIDLPDLQLFSKRKNASPFKRMRNLPKANQHELPT